MVHHQTIGEPIILIEHDLTSNSGHMDSRHITQMIIECMSDPVEERNNLMK